MVLALCTMRVTQIFPYSVEVIVILLTYLYLLSNIIVGMGFDFKYFESGCLNAIFVLFSRTL